VVPATPELTPEEMALAQRIGHSWRELRRGAAMSALRGQLFGEGDDALEPGQWDSLDLLVQRPSWRMSDLADALRVDPSTATRAVQRLLKAGLAERATCEDDGRVVRVSASDEGRARHVAISQHRRQLMAHILGRFDDDERERLAELLERFVSALDDAASGLTGT
jgi:DNA-binding MarR family transcriptional regulator